MESEFLYYISCFNNKFFKNNQKLAGNEIVASMIALPNSYVLSFDSTSKTVFVHFKI